MIKYLSVGLFLLTSPAFAQPALIGAECAPLKNILKGLQSEKINEVPGWLGISDLEGVYFALFYNKQTSAWTLLRYEKDIGCIIGYGEQSQFRNKDETIKNFPMHTY